MRRIGDHFASSIAIAFLESKIGLGLGDEESVVGSKIGSRRCIWYLL
jgi:hypothetical protein